MEETVEKLSADDIDVEQLEQRLELVQPGLNSEYYCYGDH